MTHSIFGTKHLILVGVSALLIVGLSILARRLKFEKVCKYLFYVGIVSEIVKIFYYIIQNEETHGGLLPKTDLPFHLCSIQIIFIAVLNFSQNEKLKRFLMSFMYPSCLIGGIAAIFIATNSSLNGFWVITAQYFLYHVAIVVFAIQLVANPEVRLTLKDYKNCLKMLLIIMFFAFYINSVLYDSVLDPTTGEPVANSKINFMYVVSPPQSGLPFLTEEYGWLVYIVHYACLVLTAVTLCYIRPILRAIKEGKVEADKASGEAELLEKETANV